MAAEEGKGCAARICKESRRGATMAPILNGKQKGKPQSPFPIFQLATSQKNRPWQDNERTMLDSQDTKGRWPKWANKHRGTSS